MRWLRRKRKTKRAPPAPPRTLADALMRARPERGTPQYAVWSAGVRKVITTVCDCAHMHPGICRADGYPNPFALAIATGLISEREMREGRDPTPTRSIGGMPPQSLFNARKRGPRKRGKRLTAEQRAELKARLLAQQQKGSSDRTLH